MHTFLLSSISCSNMALKTGDLAVKKAINLSVTLYERLLICGHNKKLKKHNCPVFIRLFLTCKSIYSTQAKKETKSLIHEPSRPLRTLAVDHTVVF